jgi:1-acyl-sn-glycerol-3-phosphate acyltransferase
VRRESEAHREVRPLVEDFVFHFPYLGTFMNRIGGVRACQENAERLLEDDQVVAVFPEGIKGIGKLYKERYRLQRFGRGGFIKLALRTGAPIVPVAIMGAEEIHPMMAKVTWLARSFGAPYLPITPTFPLLGPLGLLPLPTKWTIRFGPPQTMADRHGAEAAADRLLVHRLSEGVRGSIQEMLDDLLGRRKSVLFG